MFVPIEITKNYSDFFLFHRSNGLGEKWLLVIHNHQFEIEIGLKLYYKMMKMNKK